MILDVRSTTDKNLINILLQTSRDAYFTLFVDIHPGKVCHFYPVYLTNWEKLSFFGPFYPGRVYDFLENIRPCW